MNIFQRLSPNKKHKLLWILPILIITLIIKSLYTSENHTDTIEENFAKVKIELIKPTQYQEQYIGYGILEPGNKIDIISEKEGIIIEINKNEGEYLKANDIILKLDIRDYQQKFEEAESNLKKAEIELESTKKLKIKGLSSSSVFAQANAAYDNAKANYLSAKRLYESRTIKAPYDGYLSRLDVKIGQYIMDHQNLGEFIFGNYSKIRVSVSEKYISRIHMNSTAYVISSIGTLAGKVVFIGATADPLTKTFPVDIEIPHKDKENLYGLVAKAIIDIGTTESYKIPSSALSLNHDGILVIKIFKDNNVKIIPVEIIGEEEDHIYVKAAISEDLHLITWGHNAISETSKIKVIE